MYQALYRKYRPKVFYDVVGQDHITFTLKNEIKQGKVAHAYLFTGTRGTGKTTCAKIFAKAVNCLNPKDGEPCGECEICKGIENESILDVIEMDAASNSGVDNMREIIEDIRRAPMMAQRKVYIIDEVHALSPNAFNALLKTLEEPPAHAIFILATTEVHKLSATILSRCQRFDFRRVSVETISGALAKVCTSEGVGFDESALSMVARLGDGSMRDSLSILERCISAQSELTHERVLEIMGMSSDDVLLRFLGYFANRDLMGAISLLDEVYADGKDILLLCERLIWMCRCILLARFGADGKRLVSETQGGAEEIIAFSKKVGSAEVLGWADILSDSMDKLSKAGSRRLMFEMCLVRLCDSRLSGDSASLEMRIAKLEEVIESGEIKVSRRDIPSEPNREPIYVREFKEEAPAVVIKEEKIEEAPSKADESVSKKESQQTISKEQEKPKAAEPENKASDEPSAYDGPMLYGRYAKLRANIAEYDPAAASFLENTTAYIYPNKFEIIFSEDDELNAEFARAVLQSIEMALDKQLGRHLKVNIVVGEAPKLQEKNVVQEVKKERDPLDGITEYDEKSNLDFSSF